MLTSLSLLGFMGSALAADLSVGSDLAPIQRQLQKLKLDEAAERDRLESDEKLIRALEQRLDQLDAQNRTLQQNSAQLSATNHQLQTATTQQLQTIQQQISSGASPDQFASAFERYLGLHQFTIGGDAAGGFIYDRQTAQNTFSLAFQPILLYRLNDWMLFEGSIAASLPLGSGASFALPVATAQIFLNDYLEINAGIFDQPFGDWYEDQSALWVNRFITAPLLYGAEAIVPPTDIGLQLRGSVQWGKLGQDVDYTAWIANGPSFDSALSQPVVGQTLNPQNNIALNTNGRAYGTRLRVYPLPLDDNLGRLELGASTYDGKWQNALWFNAWGLDFAYLRDNLQARGEFAETYRQMPNGAAPDNRQGWYLQVGYFLQGLPSLHMGDQLDQYIRRLELLTRYSGVNQRAIVTNEITTDPGIGLSGSPSIFSPHAREVALGLDYWIEPTIVWQTEFDLELPGAGGSLLTLNGSPPALSSRPANTTPNDQAILTQLAIGF
ncbi:MAG TPA: hypothetical protein VKS22_13575 [Candidatus Binataceae bacterium]|nr:hypothetical protein [Candidatus Binataceae bacterium]